MTKDLVLSVLTAVNDFPLWDGCPSDLHQLFLGQIFKLNACLIVHLLTIRDLFLGSVWKHPICDVTFDSQSFDWQPFVKFILNTRQQGVYIQDLFSYISFLSSCPFPPLLAPISFHFLQGVGPGFTFQPRHATCHSAEHTHTHTHPWAWCKRHVTSVLSPVGSSCPRPHPHRFWAPGREEGRLYDKGT